jgi:hypothetical protein
MPHCPANHTVKQLPTRDTRSNMTLQHMLYKSVPEPIRRWH